MNRPGGGSGQRAQQVLGRPGASWCPGSWSPSGRASAGSDQIRPGQQGLDRLTGGHGLVCSVLPPAPLSCPPSRPHRLLPRLGGEPHPEQSWWAVQQPPLGEEPPFRTLGMFYLEPAGAPFRIPEIPAAAAGAPSSGLPSPWCMCTPAPPPSWPRVFAVSRPLWVTSHPLQPFLAPGL